MPVKTASLSIKALPLEVISKATQILSPSAILPSTSLFSLQVTTLNNPTLKRTYKISVRQSNLLMQKSSLFYDLSTEYTRLASYSSLNHEESSKQKLLAEEADGLPMLCIEAPVNPDNGLSLVDAFLDWLYTTANPKDTLTSSLASKIQSYQDFFSLLNLSTLLDLYEPYRTSVDEILVYYYFGLSAEERRIGILSSEQFVEGLVPGRFVKRLVEAVSENAAKEIMASFFRGKQLSNGQHELKEEWEELSLDDAALSDSGESKILEWTNTDHVTTSVPGTPLTAPLDYAEPPTPMGSAYFCISTPPPTSRTPKIHHILSRSPPHTPNAEFKPFPYSGPPNTPESMKYGRFGGNITPTGVSLDKKITSSGTPQAPPNTPNTSTSIEGTNSHLLSPSSYLASPNTPYTPRSRCSSPSSPSTPTIVISDSDFEQFSSEKSYSFIRRELFNNALSKMRKRTL